MSFLGLAIEDVKIFEEFLSEEGGKAEKELDNFLNETHAPDGKANSLLSKHKVMSHY